MISIRLIFYIALSASLFSCSSVNDLVDESSPTIEQVYNEQTRSTLNDPVKQHRKQRREIAGEYLSPYEFDAEFLSARTQTDNLFQRLPNPIIYMHVKAHPAGNSGSPIPGYVTKFFMYDRDHFAQPGELINRDFKAGVK